MKDIISKLEMSLKNNFQNNSLMIDENYFTYKELDNLSNSIRKSIIELPLSNKNIGIYCYRSLNAYASIVGVMRSNFTYVPLNPFFPSDKINSIIENAECHTIILSEECFDTFIKNIDSKNIRYLICPNPGPKIKKLKSENKNHHFKIIIPQVDLNPPDKIKIDHSIPVYIMFTSGSTGKPKGIEISHENLFSYCEYSQNKYQFSQSDKISQMFDITFDLSVHDIVLTFLSGACLYVVPKNQLLSPREFIIKNNLTVWFSVPSVASFMQKMKILEENLFPSLRYSFFCGEALPINTALVWSKAALNSEVYNLYGPTEATIAFMDYKIDDNTESISKNGIVPIGKPFRGINVKVIDNNLKVLKKGVDGELVVCGDQVISNYYKDEATTKKKFFKFSKHENHLWYRTGDIVKELDSNTFLFLGRADDQVQVRGYRVELSEIDGHVHDFIGHSMAVSIAVSQESEEIFNQEIVTFIELAGESNNSDELISYCASKMPDYMIPSKIIEIDKLPINNNGKIDKVKLKIIYKNFDNKIENTEQVYCSYCLKTLNEDKKLNGVGFIKIIDHNNEEKLSCSVCLRGF